MVGVVVGEAVIGVYFVVSHLLLQTNTGVFTVKVIAAFSKSLITFGIDANAKEVVAFIETVLRVKVHLSTKAILFQCLDA